MKGFIIDFFIFLLSFFLGALVCVGLCSGDGEGGGRLL